ncbi:hypothetical protein SAMN05519103_08561 [Rhizobiales bacterium GAS113]|nr:hypothetical protein SAMN05519103_08561 [Rhizobiales bacterium GAS113]
MADPDPQTTPSRADPFADDLDLSAFQPAPPKKPKIEKAAIRKVSEANNFPSRAPAAKPAEPTKPIRRRRTGRNVQFNIKATSETIERFVRLADSNGWVFGETLERALDALEKTLAT